MSRSKNRRQRTAQKAPAPQPYAGMSPGRRKLREQADEISLRFSRLEKPLNRVLLAVFAVAVALWLFRVVPALTARYLIVALLGISLGVNGLSGYSKSRWAGSFLMIFGTILAAGNLYMLFKS